MYVYPTYLYTLQNYKHHPLAFCSPIQYTPPLPSSLQCSPPPSPTGFEPTSILQSVDYMWKISCIPAPPPSPAS